MARRRGLLAAALALLAPVVSRAEPAIIPLPARVTDTGGAAIGFADGTAVLAAPGDAEAAGVARYLTDLAARTGGPRLTVGGGAGRGPAIRLIRRAGFAPEGYSLVVDAAGATIAASSRAGLLYGAVSLWQLLSAAPDHRLARVRINDAPRFAWRGLVLDSARHLQSPAAIKRMLDWMTIHKLNRLQWHLADDQGWRLQIDRYPRLTSVGAWRSTPPAAGLTPGRYGGFYTKAEVRRVVALAAARNITVMPEIEMPGHATAAILAYPEVGLTTATAADAGDWGVFPSIYGVDDRAFAFLHGVLDEVMALFPAREIAIGGDEAVHTLWHRSPEVQVRMKALGLKDEAALQGWFVGRIGAYLNAHGRRLVGWDEILADPALPAQDVVLSWHGADGAIAAARAGHDVVMATAPTLYLDNRQSDAPSEPPGRGIVVSLGDIYAFDPGDPPHSLGTPALGASALPHVLGVEAALWSEYIATDARLEAMALPRAAALAEIGWTARERRDWPSFVARLPAMIGRYRALGLNADDGAVAVEADIATGSPATVTLRRQLDLGDIRYTTNGHSPTGASPRYDAPFTLALPARLRAASFAGGQRLSRDLDLAIDGVSATRQASQQLATCSDGLVLNLPGRARGGTADPTYLVSLRDPCWIYRAAPLASGGHVAVGIAALPFNYQFANEAPAPSPALPAAAATPGRGELVIRRGCDGPSLATVPLDGIGRDGAQRMLVAAIPPQASGGDLCLTLARGTGDPLWALGWVELRP